jgi:dienelactone hydrolase
LLLLLGPAAARADGEPVEIWAPEPNGAQVALTARLLRPEGPGPFPAVVVLHDCLGVTPHEEAWAERLRAWGYVALVLDSSSRRGTADACRRPGNAALLGRSQDAEAARAWLAATRREVRADRIAVAGWGFGGSAALYAVHNPSERRDSPFRAAVAVYPKCAWLNPLRNQDAPLMILVGTEGVALLGGVWRPGAACERLAAEREGDRSQPLEVVVYPGAHPGFDWDGVDRTIERERYLYHPEAARDAVGRVRAFLARHLDGG